MRNKKERERLARRAAYKHERAMAVPTKIELPPGMTVEKFDRLSDYNTAYHEAGHAVAAWMQGTDSSMRYVPRGALTAGHDLSAFTSMGSFNQFISQPAKGSIKVNRGIITDSTGAEVGTINDGGVVARQKAFITLAGPFAETLGREPGLPDSVYQVMFQEHGVEARGWLAHLSQESPEEFNPVYQRLVEFVPRVFDQPVVQHCVKVLAEKFYKARALSEQEVRETIAAAWNEFDIIAKAAKAGK